jgi:hypothetical protein
LDETRRFTVLRFALLIVLAAALGFATVLETVAASKWLHLGTDFRPEVQLPLLLIQGLIALVIALATLVAAFHLFGLTDRGKPFGVPEGTLQVVIALTLILIFAIASLYLRGSLNPEKVRLEALTAAQADAIPVDQIVGKVAVEGGRFDVEKLVPVDQDAKDFSNQLLTILGTLVGAVAGFYFGAKSVETGLTAGGGNVPPSNTSPPTISGDPLVGKTLRAEDGGWTGSPPPTYGHQWQRRKVGARDWSDISGATDTTYLIAPANVDHAIRVAVTASNSAGAKTAYSAETGVIRQAPTPPADGITIALSGPPQVGTELRAVHEDWAGTPPLTLIYQWQRRKSGDAEWTPVPRATSVTYVAALADVGSVLRVSVTGSNAAGTSTAHSPETPTILQAPEPPPSGIAVELGGPPQVGTELRAVHEDWSGTPTPLLSYVWERRQPGGEWTPVPSATSVTYVAALADVGSVLRVSVTGSNAAGTSTAHSPETPTILQAPPASDQSAEGPAGQPGPSPEGSEGASR